MINFKQYIIGIKATMVAVLSLVIHAQFDFTIVGVEGTEWFFPIFVSVIAVELFNYYSLR